MSVVSITTGWSTGGDGLIKNKIIHTVENLNMFLTASLCFVDVIFSGAGRRCRRAGNAGAPQLRQPPSTLLNHIKRLLWRPKDQIISLRNTEELHALPSRLHGV